MLKELLIEALKSETMDYGASYEPHVNEYFNNCKDVDFPQVHIETLPEYDTDYKGLLRVCGNFSVNVIHSTEDVTTIKDSIERTLEELLNLHNHAKLALRGLEKQEFGQAYDANYYRLNPKGYDLEFSVNVARYKGEPSTTATIKFDQKFDFEELCYEETY